MRLALDAMGGDDAPAAMVQGAIDYARACPTHCVVLVGRESDIRTAIAAEGGAPANVDIEHAPEVIGMADKIDALKEKPDDSMNRCAQLVKQGKADAMVLCGNTGCSVASAQLHLRRVPGIKRAAILTPLPKPTGHTWVIDCGANAVGKPEQLVQFAEMTALFLQAAYGKPRPKIGVLSIGEEDEKGNELTHETLKLLRATALNVVGNVEGHHLYNTDVDIVVCDGFTGNIVLKTSEGVEAALRTIIKEEVEKRFWARIGYLLMKPAFAGVKRRVDWRQVGGCPLLGVDGITIIGHGRSNRLAVFHALRQAAHCVDTKVMETLRARFRTLAAVHATE
ncbi:MAG: phosphate acyltransferase PlsX [Planctomycetes bacterium]|nr:phosphate acyltransferase PlsX [Planctomycetota bacterium]